MGTRREYDFDDDPQMARVTAGQQLLFPANPRALCEQLGLNWWAALKLHEDGWLSFFPAATPRLDEVQEAELRFVGSLVIAGCDQACSLCCWAACKSLTPTTSAASIMIGPTAAGGCCPTRCHPEDTFAEWLDTLVECGDTSSLAGILELGQDALARVRVETAQAELVRPV